VKINELLDAHFISSLSEQAKLVESVNASLMKSAQWAIRTHKNSLALVGPLEDAARMTAWGEQAKFAELASTALAESAQRAIGTHKSSLAYVDALVGSMRATAFSSVSAQQIQGQLAGLGEEIRTLTAVLPVVASQMQTITQGLASFSTQAFEALKGAQEVWRETVCFSAEFARLQGIVGTNLAQVLREQALYYQTWLDEEYDAYTEAFVVCADYLFYRALRIVRNVEDAKDVVQDAYEKALRTLQTYSIQQIRRLNVRPWLSRIVMTTALNFLRDRRRCESYEVGWMEQRQGSRFDQPEAILVRRELLQILYESFLGLSAIQHKIIFMRYLGAESSLNEIADYLACPLGTVKGNLFRGLRALRQRLVERGLSVIDFEGLIETLSAWPYSVDCSNQPREVWEE
jgi:RNA polymerase sigma-70 factor, ECF subfamily